MFQINIKKIFLIIITISFQYSLYSITYIDAKDGEDEYKKKNYTVAEKKFNSAIKSSLEDNPSSLHFNLGNSFYNQKKYDEALEEYGKALSTKSKKDKSKIKYNIANTYVAKQKVEG